MSYCAKTSMQDWGFPIYTAAGPRILPTSAACPPYVDPRVNLQGGLGAQATLMGRVTAIGIALALLGVAGVALWVSGTGPERD